MEKKRAASNNGIVATPSKDDVPHDSLPFDGNCRHSNESHDVKKNRRVTECANNVNESPVAMIPLADEFQMQIQQIPCSHSVFSIPGAYHIEGPRLTALPRGIHQIFSCEGRGNSVLNAELVREEILDTGAATLSRPESFRLPTTDLVDATILAEKKRVNPKLLCLVACFVLSTPAILLSIFLIPRGLSTESQSNHVSSSSSGTNLNQKHQPPFPAVERPPDMNIRGYPPFQDSLPKALLQSIADTTSPFYSANLWMLGDPNLNSYSPERQRQRFYLAMLYHATNGDHWFHSDHWMSYNTSECHWYSHSSLPNDSPYYIPSVCKKNETLTSLNLAKNNLTGSLPLFPTVLMPKLMALDLDDNNISGSIPPLFSGPSLEILIISNNHFTGSWRTGDGIFDFNLKVLKNNGNLMTAGYPNNEGLLLSMMQHTIEVGNATDNRFDGTIPTELGLVTNGIYYGRGNNNLFGTLPSELGLLTHLQHMDVGGNSRLNGTIPSELGGLTALAHLDIAGTSITGSIPMNLCAKVKDGTLEIEANCSLLDCCV